MTVHRCPYKECYLPENNNKYFGQFVYLVISLGVLIGSPEQFNFFSLALYIAPILLDLIGTSVDKGNILRIIFTVLNIILLIFVLLGMFQLIDDNGSTFSVIESALLFSGFSIKKGWLALALLPNVAIPLVFWIGAPCKKKKQRMQEMKEAIHR